MIKDIHSALKKRRFFYFVFQKIQEKKEGFIDLKNYLKKIRS